VRHGPCECRHLGPNHTFAIAGQREFVAAIGLGPAHDLLPGAGIERAYRGSRDRGFTGFHHALKGPNLGGRSRCLLQEKRQQSKTTAAADKRAVFLTTTNFPLAVNEMTRSGMSVLTMLSDALRRK
jgi:hypothetical protein